MDNARIKENIIRKRTEKGISQDEMAQRLEMSRNSYRNIEKGSTYVVSRHLKEIADILKLSEGNVRVRLNRARTLLKNRIGEDWNDDE